MSQPLSLNCMDQFTWVTASTILKNVHYVLLPNVLSHLPGRHYLLFQPLRWQSNVNSVCIIDYGLYCKMFVSSETTLSWLVMALMRLKAT